VNVLEHIAGVPDFEAFATVDELHEQARALAERFPELARLRRIGSSRLGEPLWCLTVGDGPRAALVVGFPHPNEPFGGLTALHLARTLCEDRALRDELGFTWQIAYCVDPDGARLNESWFAPPLTRERYARGFYRPAGDEQVEWTFPLDYRGVYFDRVLPESLALMRLIDEVRPALMCSLHNSEVGGVYYYLTRALPSVHALLSDIPAREGLPLDVGEPEMAFIPVLAPAIFQQTTTATAYRFLEQAGEDPREHIGGGSSAEYAARHGTFSLVCEVPHWTDARAQDTTPTNRLYADVLLDYASAIDDFGSVVGAALHAVEWGCGTPFLRATRSLTRIVVGATAGVRHRAADPASRRPATVAEAWTSRAHVHMQRLREGGMLLRALDAELAAGHVTASVRRVRAEFGERFEAWLAEDAAHMPGPAAALRGPVATQYGAILAVAAAL
jgi:hypothetical protein